MGEKKASFCFSTSSVSNDFFVVMVVHHALELLGRKRLK